MGCKVIVEVEHDGQLLALTTYVDLETAMKVDAWPWFVYTMTKQLQQGVRELEEIEHGI